jgi:phosphoribosylformylglycinamidine synthase
MLDLDRERRVLAFAREAAARGLLASAQDVSGGGLAVALAECCLWADRDRGLGAFVRLPVASSPAVDLFGESPSRLVVSAVPRHVPALVLLARQHGLPIEEIGEVGATGGGVEDESADAPAPRLVVELHGSGATGSAEDRGSRVADALIVGLDELRHAWSGGLSRALGWVTR